MVMDAPFNAAPDIDVLCEHYPIPGYGLIPINAFVLKAQQPVLVDTGYPLNSDGFMDALKSVIDLEDLRWIWLTHTDRDHVGSIHRILEEAPQVRVITTFMSVGKMTLDAPLPMDRLNFLNPGEKFELGDRTITAVKPPSFDAGETVGFYDDKSEAFFSSDCFGALLQEPAFDAADVSQKELTEAQVLWATIDAPWLHSVDRGIFAKTLDGVRRMDPKVILSSHLPPARGATERFLSTLASVPGTQPFQSPDQAALEAMVAEMTGA